MWRLGTRYQAELKLPVLSVLIPLEKYERTLWDVWNERRWMWSLQITFLSFTWTQGCSCPSWTGWSETCDLPEAKLTLTLTRLTLATSLSGLRSFFCLLLSLPAHLRHQRHGKDEVQDLRRRDETKGMTGKTLVTDGGSIRQRGIQPWLVENRRCAEGQGSVRFLGLDHGLNMTKMDFDHQQTYI